MGGHWGFHHVNVGLNNSDRHHGVVYPFLGLHALTATQSNEMWCRHDLHDQRFVSTPLSTCKEAATNFPPHVAESQ